MSYIDWMEIMTFFWSQRDIQVMTHRQVITILLNSDMGRQSMTLALQLSCEFGKADCLSQAAKSLSNYPTEPDRDQKLTTYCYGIQEGGKEQWDSLWAQYQTEINANELYSIRYGLSCSKSADTLKEYLNLAIGGGIRIQDIHTAINQVSSSEYGRDVAWLFIQDNWAWFYDM